MPDKTFAPKVVSVATDKLVPYINNPKTHPGAQIDLIAGSIQEFGFLAPIVADKDNGIVAGHGRYLAAVKLGMKTIPVVRAEHLSDTQIRAYRLADNKLAESAWDGDALAMELDDLKAMRFDLGLAGFTELDKQREPNKPEMPAGMTYSVIVDFTSEADQAGFLQEMEKRGLRCRLLIA